MHCAYLAKELNVRKVIVPVAAPVFSAWGMLMTDVRHDYIQTNIRRMNEVSAQELNRMWDSLIVQADEQFQREGVAKDHVVYHFIADMRYMGQEHTVKVNVPPLPWTQESKEEIIRCFHETHEHFYTYKLLETPTEIVNLHLVAYGRLDKPELGKNCASDRFLGEPRFWKNGRYISPRMAGWRLQSIPGRNWAAVWFSMAQ